MFIPLKALLALAAGIVSLISPKLARLSVAVYLVAIGLLGIFGR